MATKTCCCCAFTFTILVLLHLCTCTDLKNANVSLTNSSVYFDIPDTYIPTLQREKFTGLTANISIDIVYELQDTTDIQYIDDALTTSMKKTINYAFSTADYAQSVIYKITTSQSSQSTSSTQYLATIYTAYLAYSTQDLEDMNKYTLSQGLASRLLLMLNYTLSTSISSFQSVFVLTNTTHINNILINVDELYSQADDDDDTDAKNAKVDKELFWIFVVVAIVMVLGIVFLAVYVMKKNYNQKVKQKLDALEKELMKDGYGDYAAPKVHIQPGSPVVGHSVPLQNRMSGSAKQNMSRLEVQLLQNQKSDSTTRTSKISSYEYDTPGHDGVGGAATGNEEQEREKIQTGSNGELSMKTTDEIDDYLAASDDEDEEVDLLYKPMEKESTVQ